MAKQELPAGEALPAVSLPFGRERAHGALAPPGRRASPFLTAVSSQAIAREAALRGAEGTPLSGSVALTPPWAYTSAL